MTESALSPEKIRAFVNGLNPSWFINPPDTWDQIESDVLRTGTATDSFLRLQLREVSVTPLYNWARQVDRDVQGTGSIVKTLASNLWARPAQGAQQRVVVAQPERARLQEESKPVLIPQEESRPVLRLRPVAKVAEEQKSQSGALVNAKEKLVYLPLGQSLLLRVPIRDVSLQPAAMSGARRSFPILQVPRNFDQYAAGRTGTDQTDARARYDRYWSNVNWATRLGGLRLDVVLDKTGQVQSIVKSIVADNQYWATDLNDLDEYGIRLSLTGLAPLTPTIVAMTLVESTDMSIVESNSPSLRGLVTVPFT